MSIKFYELLKQTRLSRFIRRPWKEKCQIISSIISSFWINNTQWIVYPIRTSYGIWIWTRSDVTGRNLRRDRELERPESLFMERFLKPGMNVLDIGANIGYFSTLISKLVGDDGTVTAFEPSTREQRWLKRNLRLNHCENVRIEKMGLSDSIGDIDLFVVQGRETGCNSMRKPNVNDRVKPVKVQITKLDNYLLSKNLSIDFVKMDIEGAEIKALKGSDFDKKIVKFSPPITLENFKISFYKYDNTYYNFNNREHLLTFEIDVADYDPSYRY